jgi:hypothetical protein
MHLQRQKVLVFFLKKPPTQMPQQKVQQKVFFKKTRHDRAGTLPV